MKFLLVFILYANIVFANFLDENKTNEINQTKIVFIKQLEDIDTLLSQMDFYIKYTNYQKYIKLQVKLKDLKKEIYRLNRKRKTKAIKEKLNDLNIKKVAYEKQLEIMGNNQNLFDSLISINPLPKPFHITNPFGILSIVSYQKKLSFIMDKYNEQYLEFQKVIKLLENKINLYKKLNKDTSKLQKILQDFELTKDIYYSKLNQLHTELKLYEQTMKDEEKAQISKLITLLIIIFISILFFTSIKFAFKKYAQKIENIYLVNKIINFLNFNVAVIIIAFFYIDNATYLVTILGFASAGIAIAMKDWFMNIFGWFVILTTGNFKVGDRIKVILQNGQIEVIGDIIDITISRIVIHEDVTLTSFEKNRRAGRIVFVPNNVIFTNPIFNYTHNGLRAVWDGIDIVITFDSNYKKAEYLAKEITKKYSKGYTDITRKQLNKLRSMYNIKNTQVEPRIYTFIGEYGIVISCWYLNNYATLNLRSKMSAEILDAFLKEDDIIIAYNTMDIKVKNEKLKEIKNTLPTTNAE